jgi:hypothetical protein
MLHEPIYRISALGGFTILSGDWVVCAGISAGGVGGVLEC